MDHLVEESGEARETDSMGVSVEHWTAICHDLQVAGLQLNITGPSSNIDTPALTDMLVPNLTTELANFTTGEQFLQSQLHLKQLRSNRTLLQV